MTQATISFQPREIVVRPGQSVKLRLLQPEDAPALLRFFQRIPGHDRFYLKDDVTSSRVIEDWCVNIDLKRVIPLVAEIEGEIVADGTLHRRRHPARRHIGEIRFVVDPRYRGRGLGTHLIYQLLELAYSNQMEKIVFELIPGQEEAAIRVAREIGFKTVAVFRNHVRDISGLSHDLMVLELDLESWYQVDEASQF